MKCLRISMLNSSTQLGAPPCSIEALPSVTLSWMRKETSFSFESSMESCSLRRLMLMDRSSS